MELYTQHGIEDTIYFPLEETNDWIVDFNKEFDNKRNENNEINPYDN